jgi:hypothetical protein
MTCTSALELMLDAEPSELYADGNTPLSTHLRDCARCRRVASQLAQDTQLLAHMLPVAPVKRPARRATPTLVPAFALAAIVLAVTLRSRAADEPVLPPTPVRNAVAVVEASAPLPAPRTPNAAAPRVSRIRQAPLRAFAPAVAVAPVRFEPAVVQSSVQVSPGTVTVTPPAGTRATVMQTSNPKLVVVWLY